MTAGENNLSGRPIESSNGIVNRSHQSAYAFKVHGPAFILTTKLCGYDPLMINLVGLAVQHLVPDCACAMTYSVSSDKVFDCNHMPVSE